MEKKLGRIQRIRFELSLNRKLCLFLVFLIICDYGLTIFALQTFPVKELNPIFLSPTYVTITAAILCVFYYFAADKELARFFRIFALIVIAARVFAIGNNIVVLTFIRHGSA